jgi:Ethylbenzene dehydrogenase/Prokaryotic cytochrome b561
LPIIKFLKKFEPNVTPTHTSRRSDLPTVVLHWGLVLALLLSVSTGWRIARMTDSSALMRWVDVLLLQGNVVRWHFVSASLLTALVIAYLAFLWRMGLGGRLALRLASLRSPDRTTRWQAINRLVYWVAFALLAGAAVTGAALYFFPGLVRTEGLVRVHQWLSWCFVAYIVLHVAAQVAMGGIGHLLKIVSPRLAYGVGAATALAAGMAGAAVTYFADTNSLARLVIARTTAAPVLDGDPSDALWQDAPEAVVHTIRGFGLDGGEVDVHVRALHDDKRAWFLFRWPDATRSQKHVPVIKTATGWKLVHSNYFNNDENEFYEDKFAVMLAQSPIAGGNAVRLGPKPLADKPGPSNGLGLHVTTDGSLADVWHWKSVRSGALNQFDDNYFGAAQEPKPGRYMGGYAQDPKTGGGFDQNFERIGKTSDVKVKFLPRNLAAQQARMGHFDPSLAVSDLGSYAMARADVVAWTPELDARIPVGTVLPSVVYDKPFEGDRGDIEVHAQWKDGWWTLEATRVLDTGSKFDQPIADGMFMWFGVFDHNQVRHTRHVRPLRLQLQ